MYSGSFSAGGWNQGKYNPTTGEYNGASDTITTGFISVQNAMQTVTRIGDIVLLHYKNNDHVVGNWYYEDTIIISGRLLIHLYDVNDNRLTDNNGIECSKDNVVTSVKSYPTAVKLMVQITRSTGTISAEEPSGTGYNWYQIAAPVNLEYTSLVWDMNDGGFPHPEEATVYSTEFAPPYPKTYWRIADYYNNGFPFNRLIPNIPYNPPPPAPTIDPVEFYDEYNAEYLSALRQKHRRYKVRLELLGYYENVVGEITRDLSRGSSGQITVNNEQITRRSCSLSLINVNKKYLPSPDSPIWFNKKFKLWIGVVIGKHTYWWSYGVFYTTKATCDGNTVNIQGVDKGGALDGTIKTGMLDTSCIVEAGTTLTNVIKDTLMWNEFSSPYLNHRTGASAYPVDPITPIISTKFDGIVTQNEITINSNDYISTLFSSIADGYGADAYYNTNGHFCFQVMADESRIDGYRFMAHQWDFSDEDDMYSNASVDFNLDGYNVVTVYTNESDLENVSYTAANNNPASPLRLDSAGIRRMADVEIPYVNVPQSEMQARCKAYADYLLMREAMQGMSITFSCPIIPHLDVNRTIGITDKRYNLDHATFVVNSITMPLSAEAMTVNATQTSWLPDNTGIEGGGI